MMFKETCQLSRIAINTTAGPLMLRNINCFVHDLSKVELTMSMSVMQALGHSTQSFLSHAASVSPEYDLHDVQTEGRSQNALRLVTGEDGMDTDDESDAPGAGSAGNFIP